MVRAATRAAHSPECGCRSATKTCLASADALDLRAPLPRRPRGQDARRRGIWEWGSCSRCPTWPLRPVRTSRGLRRRREDTRPFPLERRVGNLATGKPEYSSACGCARDRVPVRPNVPRIPEIEEAPTMERSLRNSSFEHLRDGAQPDPARGSAPCWPDEHRVQPGTPGRAATASASLATASGVNSA